MAAVGVNGVDAAKTILESAADAGKQFKVLLLDLWLQRPTDAPEFVQYLHVNPHLVGSRSRSKVFDVSQLDQEMVRSANRESDDVEPELPPCLRTSSGVEIAQAEAAEIEAPGSEHLKVVPTDQDLTVITGQRPSPRGQGKVHQHKLEVEQAPGSLPGKSDDVPSAHRNLRSLSRSGKALSIVMLTSVDHPDAAK